MRLLTVAALNGAFQGRVEQPVNYVNAPLVAAERGIKCARRAGAASRDFTSLVRVTAAKAGTYEVAGTVIGRDHQPRLVRALGYEVEIELASLVLFVVNEDRPGVIGRLGTILGEEDQHRQHGGLPEPPQRRGADGADPRQPIPPEVLERRNGPAVEARSIVLERA